ncbi:MAG TPA: protein-L-isoaspartate(D-aspartate) O-methyltransferase [Candidatus Acidoferrales bacterium]|nr:protein-L-isoaspartate(D-aspartate) O-methyltransferase [Candidatus Acidoferrales bacterium]
MHHQDYSWARERMVRAQLVERGIGDPRVLEAMRRCPRHLFVEPVLVTRAYSDSSLPIGLGQTISQPYIVGLMTEALQLKGNEKVLEIGTGSGYQTAILAELAQNVFSVERVREIATRARAILDELKYYNVAIQIGDGTIGWPEHAPYDAILVSAASPSIPRPFLEQLSAGGRLVIPLGDEKAQRLMRVWATPSGPVEEDLGECRFVKLVGKYGWSD